MQTHGITTAIAFAIVLFFGVAIGLRVSAAWTCANLRDEVAEAKARKAIQTVEIAEWEMLDRGCK